MPRHKRGTLVMVKPEALDSREFSEYNLKYTTEHGWVWLVEGWSDRDGFYTCKSLTTGHKGAWMAKEITTRGAEA